MEWNQWEASFSELLNPSHRGNSQNENHHDARTHTHSHVHTHINCAVEVVASLKGTKLWPNIFSEKVFACFSTMLPSGLAPPSGSALSAKVSFHSVCMSYECVSIRLMFALCVMQRAFNFGHTQDSLLKHTLDTRQFKRKAYRKKKTQKYI